MRLVRAFLFVALTGFTGSLALADEAKPAEPKPEVAPEVTKKKVPYLDESGQRVEPAEPNALKFEKFIFDVLPFAERWTVVETPRDEEFAPLKNDSGPDSPETVRQALIDTAVRWLRQVGAAVPDEVPHPLEISPLFALDAEELKEKLPRDYRIAGPTHLE